MRFAFFVLACGCGQPPTSLLVEMFSSASLPDPPTTLAVSVWDAHGPLVLGRTAHGHVPGTLLITNLPDLDQRLRIGLFDGDKNTPTMGFQADTIAHQETRVSVHLDGATDADGDQVPDSVDNCPDDANRQQTDGNGDGVGDACAGRDLGMNDLSRVPDLAGADLARPPCNALFCDGFEDDLVAPMALTAPNGALRWALDDNDPQAVGEIDFAEAALGARSLRFRLTADTVGGKVAVYQRYGPGITLYPGVPNYGKLLSGPTYIRFYTKFSAPPFAVHGDTVTLGYVFWGGNPTDNFELRATSGGVDFNDRFAFGNPTAQYTPVGVDWTGWTCVEWKHESVLLDGGMGYRSTASVNGVEAATFEGTGTPPMFGGFILAADIEFRVDMPDFTRFTQWFDEVKLSDQPIGCGN